MSDCISSLTYTDGIFNDNLFITSIIDKYDLKNMIISKEETELSKKFIKFILEYDVLISKRYINLEHEYKLWGEKLQTSNEKLNQCYFNEFYVNHATLNKYLKKLRELSEAVKNDISIYNTLKENNIKIIAEIDNNKKGNNDAHVRTLLLNKLKKSEETLDKYAIDIKNTEDTIKELQKNIDELESKRTEASVKYCKIKSDIQFFSAKVHDIISALDKLYDVDVSNFLIKHNLIITDYIMISRFVETLKHVITGLKRISDSYDLALQLDVIKNCFLNCNYSETITSNGTHFIGSKGTEIYTSGKFQPSLKLRLKSFKLLHYSAEYIKQIKDNMNDISIYVEDLRSSDTTVQSKVISKTIPKLYIITNSIFSILYGDCGLVFNKPPYKGLSERGVVSPKVYLHDFQSKMYKYGKKEVDDIVYSSVYHTILSELYKLSVINMAINYDFKVNDLVINKLKSLSDSMDAPEIYNRYLQSHQKINEKK